MHIDIQLTDQPIVVPSQPARDGGHRPPLQEREGEGALVEFSGIVRGQEDGLPIVVPSQPARDGGHRPPPQEREGEGALVEFSGIVRGQENGQPIAALVYEAYPEMAGHQIRRLLVELAGRHPCLAARVIHRLGTVPVGEVAIYVGVTSRHRAEGIALLAAFMDRLKQDVPIWKRRAVPAAGDIQKGSVECPMGGHADVLERHLTPALSPILQMAEREKTRPSAVSTGMAVIPARSLSEAMADIQARCQPLAGVRRPLREALGQVLGETVVAPGDLPPFDCATRDGYAVLAEDPATVFQVVDTIYAADWQPRQLLPGQAVRVATGAALPCAGLRVVMQEDAVRTGAELRITTTDRTGNVRRRGSEVRAGDTLLAAGTRLTAGAVALLAAAGCTQPLVSPRLRVSHFTIGDELVAPEGTPGPGQIRDSNSLLICGLLAPYPAEVEQARLPEELDGAWRQLQGSRVMAAEVVLISGGASVGDKDFTRSLLERLGFEIVFAQVNIRPGKPLIFGVNGTRVAFGLPGNPLAHWVCFHFAVATALARLAGDRVPAFQRGRLAEPLVDEPVPRETLWPARLELAEGGGRVHPLAWSSSGDVRCFGAVNALLRVPPHTTELAAGLGVDFLPATALSGLFSIA